MAKPKDENTTRLDQIRERLDLKWTAGTDITSLGTDDVRDLLAVAEAARLIPPVMWDQNHDGARAMKAALAALEAADG
jgi:hypothetical protein